MAILIEDFTEKNYPDYLRLSKMYTLNLEQLGSQKYLEESGKKGFLIGESYDLEDVMKAPINLVGQVEGKVVGLIRIDDAELDNDGKLDWLDEEAEKFFSNGKSFQIGLIIVDEDYGNQGIGGKLLAEAEARIAKLGYKYLFSWVVSSPYNKASMDFHKKKGFKHVGTFDSEFYDGVKNYQSQLLFKKI